MVAYPDDDSAVDLRGMTMGEMERASDQADLILRFARRYGSYALPRSLQREGFSTIGDALGLSTGPRLSDLHAAASRLLGLLLIDVLISGETPLQGLSDRKLFKRLDESHRLFLQEWNVGGDVDGRKKSLPLTVDEICGPTRILADGIAQQPGDEAAPCVEDAAELTCIDRDFGFAGTPAADDPHVRSPP